MNSNPIFPWWKKILWYFLQLIYSILTIGLKKGVHITRYTMYKRISWHNTPRPDDHKVLCISHSEQLAYVLGFNESQITNATYSEFNILDLPFSDGEFDAVVSDQVLEHIEGSPEKAMNECFRVLKPSGFVCHTTVFINPIHGYPHDYWRYTPEGLKHLVSPYAKIVEVEGWGNPYAWILIGIGWREMPIPHARWHSFNWLAIKNSPTMPITTWVIAIKV